jgi:heat shock protein HspQ
MSQRDGKPNALIENPHINHKKINTLYICLETTTMKLTEFDNKKISNAKRALKENYELPFNVDRMTMPTTKAMINKVRGLVAEAKTSPSFYKEQASPSYMKLVFMEQALVAHYQELRSQPQPRIVVENEEIEKSQVYLAAQDLVDSVQKMLEDVGQMQVKELPALTSSIESEIGVNESQSYNDAVTQQLDALTATLKESLGGLKEALNGLTGQGGAEAFAPAGDDMGADMAAGAEDMAAGAEDMAAGAEDLAAADDISVEEPPEEPLGSVGRAKR